MSATTGTGSAASSPASQHPTGASTDWEAEAKRLQGEVNSRDAQIRGLSSIRQAWETNVGRELGDTIEYDASGRPVKVTRESRVYGGANPLASYVDPSVAQQHDEYMRQQLGAQFVTPQQLQAQVNAAKQEAYLAATSQFQTLRHVDRTITDPRFKELADLNSSLAKKTEEVLARNQWGQRSSPQAKSWEEFQYAAPNALSIAAQIAKAELFEASQSTQESNAYAQTVQSAASIAAGGGSPTATPGPSTEEMTRMFREDPVRAEALAKEQFVQKTGVGR